MLWIGFCSSSVDKRLVLNRCIRWTNLLFYRSMKGTAIKTSDVLRLRVRGSVRVYFKNKAKLLIPQHVYSPDRVKKSLFCWRFDLPFGFPTGPSTHRASAETKRWLQSHWQWCSLCALLLGLWSWCRRGEMFKMTVSGIRRAKTASVWSQCSVQQQATHNY